MLTTSGKLGLALAISAIVTSWGVRAENTATATSAKINITATVTAKTCTPSWTQGTVTKVDLGKVATADLGEKGDVGAVRPFILSLTDCDAGVTTVSVGSSGSPDAVDKTAYANISDEEGAAKGVAVTLFGGPSQSTQLTPDGKASAVYPIDATTHAVDMMFLAKLESTGDSNVITAGPVESAATFYMTYE